MHLYYTNVDEQYQSTSSKESCLWIQSLSNSSQPSLIFGQLNLERRKLMFDVCFCSFLPLTEGERDIANSGGGSDARAHIGYQAINQPEAKMTT